MYPAQAAVDPKINGDRADQWGSQPWSPLSFSHAWYGKLILVWKMEKSARRIPNP
jgi:hypothetical protein